MRLFLLLGFSAIFFQTAKAGRISGTVTDADGKLLPFASILVKGSTKGTTSNNEGRYFINLEPGEYILICQYVGYERQEQRIKIGNESIQLDFVLARQALVLTEVVVKRGEDPAYAIIREAIRKRPFYLDQLKRFQCEVYTKGQLKLRDFPKRFMGQKVDFEDGDTSRRKMLFLSETISTYSVEEPKNVRVEVHSSKVSGQSESFGLSAPQIISFYENNISIGTNLNPRGFISPIAAGALIYYRYKYEGAFFEEGKQVNRIRVIPRRKFEPLFSGIINIVENDWRIHSLQLTLTQESQMQLMDTMRIEQLSVPHSGDFWVVKTQVLYPAIKILGFDVHGSFVNVYSDYDLNPQFEKGFFNKTVIKYMDSANKKTAEYWEEARPLPLQEEEATDYRKKDSLELVRKDPRYLDSLDRRRNRLSPTGMLLMGQNFSNRRKRENYFIKPLMDAFNFNTVEGWVINAGGTYTKRLDSNINSRRRILFSPVLRYGFANRHFNAHGSFTYNYGKKYPNSISMAGGKRVMQFNNDGPVSPRYNTYSTLLWERNYMKLYEAWFGQIGFSSSPGEGFSWNAQLQFQDRGPLENSSVQKWSDKEDREYTHNYPVELTDRNLQSHQALIIKAGIRWQPGARYVEFPERKISLGSKFPVFSLSYTHGVRGLFGSDIDYSKWQFGVSDAFNFKLAGQFAYRVAIGGFLHADSVAIPDYTHFYGNQLTVVAADLNTFRLAPYYKYSNTEKFYTTIHAEHHFNGLLTNKIPLFRKLNWWLVGGAGAFYVNSDINYVEVSGGIENILKVIRVDFVQAFESGSKGSSAIRISLRGAFSGRGD